jgi:hypothetical protein
MLPPQPRHPGHDRAGFRLIRDLTPQYRACDDELLVCHGIIYAFPVWEISADTGLILLYETDPATGRHLLDRDGKPIRAGQVPDVRLARPDARPRIVFDYVGQTIRPLQVREAEHVEEKNWADVIAGSPVVIAEGEWDKAVRDRREIASIVELRPRFNKEYNDTNPNRIEIRRQVQLRHARDDALNRPRWIPLDQRTAVATRIAELDVIGGGLDGREPRYPMAVLGRTLTGAGRWIWAHPRIRAAAGLLGLWVGLLVASDMVLLRTGWPTGSARVVAAFAATAMIATLAGGRKRKRHRRRRR